MLRNGNSISQFLLVCTILLALPNLFAGHLIGAPKVPGAGPAVDSGEVYRLYLREKANVDEAESERQRLSGLTLRDLGLGALVGVAIPAAILSVSAAMLHLSFGYLREVPAIMAEIMNPRLIWKMRGTYGLGALLGIVAASMLHIHRRHGATMRHRELSRNLEEKWEPIFEEYVPASLDTMEASSTEFISFNGLRPRPE